jgi:hypothetical protein
VPAVLKARGPAYAAAALLAALCAVIIGASGGATHKADGASGPSATATFAELGRSQTAADKLDHVPDGVDPGSVRAIPSPVPNWDFWIATSTSPDLGGSGVCLLFLGPEDRTKVLGPAASCKPSAQIADGLLTTTTLGQSDHSRARVLWLVPQGASNAKVLNRSGAAVPTFSSGSLRVSDPASLGDTQLTVAGTQKTTDLQEPTRVAGQ